MVFKVFLNLLPGVIDIVRVADDGDGARSLDPARAEPRQFGGCGDTGRVTPADGVQARARGLSAPAVPQTRRAGMRAGRSRNMPPSRSGPPPPAPPRFQAVSPLRPNPRCGRRAK